MPTSRETRINRRRNWLNAFMAVSTVALVACLALLGILVSRPAGTPITVTQADRVTLAASYLQDVGFNNPVYLGVTPSTEGKYPTFRATAIGGKPVNLFVRTTINGGWEIQPSVMFESVASAEDFARKATDAVDKWVHIPSDIKPRTDGNWGEYESRKYEYEQLKQYAPGADYWKTARPNETTGWPSK